MYFIVKNYLISVCHGSSQEPYHYANTIAYLQIQHPIRKVMSCQFNRFCTVILLKIAEKSYY